MAHEYNIGNYKLVSYKGLSYQEWLDVRNSFGLALGGSDMSVIMGVNEYASLPMLFDQKLGLMDNPDLSMNKSVFWGREFETNILDVSQYMELNDNDSYLRNFPHNRVRNHVQFEFTTQTSTIPWLFANVDGLQVESMEGIVSPNSEDVHELIASDSILPIPEAILEIKTMNKHVYDKWGSAKDGTKGLPIGYIYQVLTYMMQFTEMNPNIEGYIFSLVAGLDFHAYRVVWNQDVIDDMLEKSYNFYQQLLKGKEVIDNGGSDKAVKTELDMIRPEADGSLAYQKYMNQNYLEKLSLGNTMLGDDKVLEMAENYKEAAAKEKEAMKEKLVHGNKIREALFKADAKQIDLPYDKGYVRYDKKLTVKLNK